MSNIRQLKKKKKKNSRGYPHRSFSKPLALRDRCRTWFKTKDETLQILSETNTLHPALATGKGGAVTELGHLSTPGQSPWGVLCFVWTTQRPPSASPWGLGRRVIEVSCLAQRPTTGRFQSTGPPWEPKPSYPPPLPQTGGTQMYFMHLDKCF